MYYRKHFDNVTLTDKPLLYGPTRKIHFLIYISFRDEGGRAWPGLTSGVGQRSCDKERTKWNSRPNLCAQSEASGQWIHLNLLSLSARTDLSESTVIGKVMSCKTTPTTASRLQIIVKWSPILTTRINFGIRSKLSIIDKHG